MYTDTHTCASTHRTTHINTQTTHVHRSEYTRICTHGCTHMWTHRTTHMRMCLYTGSHLCTHVNPPPTCVHTHRDTQAIESGEERKGPGLDGSQTTDSWLCCFETPHYACDGPPPPLLAFVRRQPTPTGKTYGCRGAKVLNQMTRVTGVVSSSILL